jgi:glycosyltransferase involved in cell wall biosynthesis
LSVGRLDKLKNHPLLLRAFAQLRRRIECRLIVLGEGEQLEKLIAEARELGIADDVDFAGFSRNPMSFMRQADLFVLSSDFEGLSNVLIEAMAVGCPVVSTDAPHGPREVLQDGRLGRLVPVGDADGLARAMEETLRDPGDATLRRQWAKAFSVSASADQYLRTAGL